MTGNRKSAARLFCSAQKAGNCFFVMKLSATQLNPQIQVETFGLQLLRQIRAKQRFTQKIHKLLFVIIDMNRLHCYCSLLIEYQAETAIPTCQSAVERLSFRTKSNFRMDVALPSSIAAMNCSIVMSTVVDSVVSSNSTISWLSESSGYA